MIIINIILANSGGAYAHCLTLHNLKLYGLMPYNFTLYDLIYGPTRCGLTPYITTPFGSMLYATLFSSFGIFRMRLMLSSFTLLVSHF